MCMIYFPLYSCMRALASSSTTTTTTTTTTITVAAVDKNCDTYVCWSGSK